MGIKNSIDPMHLDDLICEIAHECGYRNYSPPEKGSSNPPRQLLKFIKFFNDVDDFDGSFFCGLENGV